MAEQLALFSKEEQQRCGMWVVKDIKDLYEIDFLCPEEIEFTLMYEKDLAIKFLSNYEPTEKIWNKERERYEGDYIYFYIQEHPRTVSHDGLEIEETVKSRGLWRDFEYVLLRFIKQVSSPKGDYEITLGQLGGERLRFQDVLMFYAKENGWETETKPKQVKDKTTGKLITKQYLDKIWIRKKI